MATSRNAFRGNQNLKQIGEKLYFTEHQVQEYAKCSQDPIYFLENYGKIVAVGKGVVPFKLFVYQKRMIHAILNNRKIIGKIGRQMGKSQIVAGYFAWFVLFGGKNTHSAILANKMAVAKEIFSRVQFIIENCPKWLQQGVAEWNKTSLTLENGSTVFCSATSPSAIRGFSLDAIFCDEFAHLSSNLADEFIASVFPTISSSDTAKLIIVSTPKGLNHFAKIYIDAESGKNGFAKVNAEWYENPGRDQAWLDNQRAELGELKFQQEVMTNFNSSSNTLVQGSKIASLVSINPIRTLPNLKEYFNPIPDHQYVMTVDVSRGANLDYSTFTIFDISTMPYEVVSTFRDNTISTLVFPEIIFKSATKYNAAFVLIETNDLGQQVADTLFYDLEYENVYMTVKEEIKEGGGKNSAPGCRTTTRTKAVGCDILKGLIENDSLMVNDAETITEFSTFIRKGKSYCADDQKHDDMVMTHVMFAYLTTQPVFKDLFDYSLREQLYKRQLQDIDEQMLPLGYVNRGDSSKELETMVIGNDVWQEWGEGQDLYVF